MKNKIKGLDHKDYLDLIRELVFCGAKENLLWHLKNPILKILNFKIEVDKFNHKLITIKGDYLDDKFKTINSEVTIHSRTEWTILLNN